MLLNNQYHIALDTEDDGNGNPIMGVIYISDGVYEIRHTMDDIIEFLADYTDPTIKTIVWCTNLEYDLCNIFTRKQLLDVRMTFGKSKMISAEWAGVKFFDTLNHWPFSVKRMGDFIGIPKLDFDPNNPDYCVRDAEITYKFVCKMLRTYNSIGVPLKPTIASSALSYWQQAYSTGRYYKHPDHMIDEIKNAYYGGRTECFRIGEIMGDIKYIDVNSMYPFVMKSFNYPNPNNLHHSNTKEWSNVYYQQGVVEATVYSDLEIPVLPYRDKSGCLIFPNGEFRGWWTIPELYHAVGCGVEIKKIHNSYTTQQTCSPFGDYVDELYTLRKKSKSSEMKLILKLLLNCLYGKFGQGNERTHMCSRAEYIRNHPKNVKSSDVFGDDFVLYTTEEKYPYHSQMMWAAYVTSYARIMLHRRLMMLNFLGHEILYCDTDSVIYKSTGGDLSTSDELGDWSLEGEYEKIIIQSPKQYALEDNQKNWIYHVKGVPRDKAGEFIKTGHAKFRKPNRLRESIRRGLVINKWEEIEKNVRGGYRKGEICSDGRIKPFTIGK